MRCSHILGNFSTALPCGHLCHRASASASLRFTFSCFLIFIAFFLPCAKRAASGFVRVFQTKGCSCAAGMLILMSFVALARSNELVRCCGGENHPFDARLPMCVCQSAGSMWFRAPAAGRPSPGRARARASSQRSSRLYTAGYRLICIRTVIYLGF